METQQADAQLTQGARAARTSHGAATRATATAPAPSVVSARATSGGTLESPEKTSRGGALDSRVIPSARTTSQAGHPCKAGAGALCVVHVTPGHERAMARRVARLSGDALSDCFVLRTEYRVRRHGAWNQELFPTFPSYLFIGVADPELLERRLGLLSSHASIPRVGDGMARLPQEDAETLRALGGADHVIRFSQGSVENGELRVWRGALVGREELVCRIDRHKRCAWLRTGLGEGLMRVGLELVTKT